MQMERMYRGRPNPMGRCAVRLARLQPEELVSLLARLCEEVPYARHAVDATLSLRDPVREEVRDGVLLSDDLMPRILARLEREDAAAAAVCSSWHRAWNATEAGRRRLRVPMPVTAPAGLKDIIMVSALPRGTELCVVHDDGESLSLVDTKMAHGPLRVLQTYGRIRAIAAGEHGIYASVQRWGSRMFPDRILRISLQNLAIVAEHSAAEVEYFYQVVLQPGGGALFVGAERRFSFNNTDRASSTYHKAVQEVVVFDQITLERRSVLYRQEQTIDQANAYLIEIVGQDLYVGMDGRSGSSYVDTHHSGSSYMIHCYDCWHVYSFSGEHMRTIHGQWISVCKELRDGPAEMLSIGSRLYLRMRRHILVITPDGELLQVYSPEKDVLPLYYTIVSLCPADGRLLVTATFYIEDMPDSQMERFLEEGEDFENSDDYERLVDRIVEHFADVMFALQDC